jgi:hypothetical protein
MQLESKEGKPMRKGGILPNNANGDNQENKEIFVISKRRIKQIKLMWLDDIWARRRPSGGYHLEKEEIICTMPMRLV